MSEMSGFGLGRENAKKLDRDRRGHSSKTDLPFGRDLQGDHQPLALFDFGLGFRLGITRTELNWSPFL
jgi:hypothetical protein